MKRLAVIDGKSVFYRGYYAMPGLSTADGTPTGGVYGFASLALELIKKLEPDYVAVAWDKQGTNIRRRRQLYPEYKAGRTRPPEDFFAQIPLLYQLLEAFSWPLYELDDYEADDILGAFARQAEARGIETCLLTSDLDALQLISPLTKVYAMKNGLRNIEEFTAAYFEQKYGIRTDQFLDFKALKGDSSDNLPGVPGVGEKTAIKLLQQYDTLDGVYQHIDEQKGALRQKLREGKRLAYLTKQVAALWTDAPLQLDWQAADIRHCQYEQVRELLRRFEFHSLERRLPAPMQAEQVSAPPQDDEPLPTLQPLPALPLFEAETYVYIDTVEPDIVYLLSGQQAYRAALADTTSSLWRLLGQGTVIAHDVKKLYHALDRIGVQVQFAAVWDVGQAAFLLSPLRRDRSLAGLDESRLSDDTAPARQLLRLRTIHQEQQRQMQAHPKLDDVAQRFDFPVIWPLFCMEQRGIRLDESVLKQIDQELTQQLWQIEQEMYTIVGHQFNPGSPAQLSDILFGQLGLPTTGIKKGKTGYSTGQKELDKLRDHHPIIGLIERYREIAKLLNTYVEALPKLADQQSRLHTTFRQDVTSTGRLSSANPNLQNIPVRTELGRRIRQAFVPSPGRLFVSADYSQFELRLAAALAGDHALIDDFNHDVDIHTKTAAEVYGIPMAQVTTQQRRAAKVINFGVLYGMSPHGLATATGMSVSEATHFIDHYFAMRHPIRRYLDTILAQAKQQGYVETYFGRRRPTPDVRSSNYMVRSAAERAAMNMPIQGTEADLMKLAMIRLEQALAGRGEQVLQIHDSILVECPADQAQTVGDILRLEMEQICPALPIRLKVDVTTGAHWGEV